MGTLCACVLVRVCVCMYVWMYVHVWMCVCVCVCVSCLFGITARVCAFVRRCMRVCVYALRLLWSAGRRSGFTGTLYAPVCVRNY